MGMRQFYVDLIIFQVRQLCNQLLGRDPSAAVFPGAQPVSLAESNISLLQSQEYRVTWKADGTRYLMLILGPSVYLVNRSFEVLTRILLDFELHYRYS